MNPVGLRGYAVAFAAALSVGLLAFAVPAHAGAVAGTGAVATTVGALNADLRGKIVTDVRRRGRGFRGRGFRGRAYRGRVRGYRRYRRRGYRRYRRYRRYGYYRPYRKYRRYRRYYRPRIYYSGPVVYGYRSRYYGRCYRPCRWSGHGPRYCRRYCRRHRHW